MAPGVVAVLLAVASAAAAAVATAIQHRSASGSAPAPRPTGALARFARHQLTSRLYLLSLPVQLAGLLLHAAALDSGALALVQPVLVASVVLALPLNHLLNREPFTARELIWAGLLVAGITGFLWASGARTVRPGPVDDGSAVVTLVIGVVVVTGLIAAANLAPRAAAVLLGTAAGLVYAAQAAFLQGVTGDVTSRGLAGLAGAALPGLLVTGCLGIALQQLAFRSGSLAAGMSALTVVNPLASIVIGLLVYREQLRDSSWAVCVEVLALALLVTATTALVVTTNARPARERVPAGR